ncbi:MAG: PA14 domain-containing protein [Phycisphaerales bacterium]
MHKAMTYSVCLLWVMSVATPLLGQLPAGWTSAGVGSPTVAGSAQYDASRLAWTVRGEGTGIRASEDQFHFVYKTLSGDGELVARVVSIDPALADWSMAGVMIRVLLTPGSPYLFMGASANTEGGSHAITFWGRETMNGAAQEVSSGTTFTPLWVKVKRTGDTFSAFSSLDNKTWISQYSTSVPGIPKSVYVGYAVASEVAGELVTAAFDNGPIEATKPDPADGAQYIQVPYVSWTAGVTAAFHDIYFGTTPDLGADELMARYTVEAHLYWHLPGIAPGTTYYWRIDEVAADGATIYPGAVWSFTAAPSTAYLPVPWNGLDGVDVDADLAWTAGMTAGVNAKSHDVYFGADKAAVKAGDAGVFQGNISKLTYDPGTLAENTTYYWRIDEYDATGQLHPGEVWSFTTVGPGIGVHAEYFKGTEPVGSPVVTRTEDSIDHDWGSNEVAGGLSDAVSARWTADLEAPLTETYQLITTTDDGVRLWLDGRLIIDNWTDHGTTDNTATVDLVAGRFYLVKMEWYDKSGGAVAQLSWQSPSIGRQVIPAGVLQLPVHATTPYPAAGSVHVPQAPILSWTAAEVAAQQDVFFGEDADAVADADVTAVGVYQGRQDAAASTFDPGELEWNKTYYWRVDEVNNAGSGSPWAGSVWSFTTADFLVVDDFETYTDDIDAGEAIYQTWTDTWFSNNECGSLVGYIDAPFTEHTIVHEGYQSMPLRYDNTCSPHYAEITRVFSSVQDWTVEGVDTLVLFVRGKIGNDAAPLYVGLEDSTGKVAYVRHPDAGIVKTTVWTKWSIPLSEFTGAGVKATKIETMYIGVGDRSNPVAGTSGQIFIDDIRVVKP